MPAGGAGEAGCAGADGALLGVGEGRVGGAAAGPAPSDGDHVEDARRAQPGDELHDPGPPGLVAEPRQLPGRVRQHLPVAGDQGQEQQREAHHDQPVGRTDPGAALERGVTDDLGEHAHQSADDRAQALARHGSAHAHAIHDRATGTREDGHAHHSGESDHDGADETHDRQGGHAISLVAGGGRTRTTVRRAVREGPRASSRSVEFRLEIGPVPCRDRSGSASRSVRVRGQGPRRGLGGAKSVRCAVGLGRVAEGPGG